MLSMTTDEVTGAFKGGSMFLGARGHPKAWGPGKRYKWDTHKSSCCLDHGYLAAVSLCLCCICCFLFLLEFLKIANLLKSG